jgi:hypothetical protein
MLLVAWSRRRLARIRRGWELTWSLWLSIACGWRGVLRGAMGWKYPAMTKLEQRSDFSYVIQALVEICLLRWYIILSKDI